MSAGHVRIACVMPVGPNCASDHVTDSLRSLLNFCPLTRVVLVDDSGIETATRVVQELREYEITCISSGETRAGLRGGLYHTLSRGFVEALERDFDILVRMDTDALAASGSFANAAAEIFRANPQVGCVGALDSWYDGSTRSHSWPAKRLLRMIAPRRAIVSPRPTGRILSLVARAGSKGYRLGRSVFGGACIYSYRAVSSLGSSGLLDLPDFVDCELEEDHIFGLLLAAAGYRLDDPNVTHPGTVAMAWRTLPDSPSALLTRRVSLIHSVKGWHGWDEDRIRAYFRDARSGGGGGEG